MYFQVEWLVNKLNFFIFEYFYQKCNLKVAGLFPRDEMDEICNELIPVMKKEYPRRAPTNENLYEYFLSRTRQNLHVVLCFSPVNNLLDYKKLFNKI